MDFWNAYEMAKLRQGFSASRLLLSAREERIHTSLSAVSAQSVSINKDECVFKKYSEGERYVLAQDIGSDLLITIYNVNSSCAILLRPQSQLTDRSLSILQSDIRKLRKPNFEVRLIGLRDNATDPLKSVSRIEEMVKPSNLQEVDLFGNEVRHIAFDLKLGMAYNLLLLDRIYEPSELFGGDAEKVNTLASELKFV